MAKRGRTQIKLSFGKHDPQTLKQQDPKALRKEYTRLRDIAQKRLKRLGESEFDDSAAFTINRYKFKKLSEIKSADELADRLSALIDFIQARSSTVSGQKGMRRERIATLHSHGYTWVNESNLREFGEFMQYLKAKYPHVPSASEAELHALYKGWKTVRNRETTADEVEAAFERWHKSHHPDSFYLQPTIVDIDEDLIHSELPKEFRS